MQRYDTKPIFVGKLLESFFGQEDRCADYIFAMVQNKLWSTILLSLRRQLPGH